ncbi:MAG: 16S rRNA (adenine(1518)-N(6)/adenine(1519)-N(6))-dimethyltransferase RsmA [Thermoguttaceae bacterium]
MTTNTNPAQTRSYLMKRFEAIGINPRTKLGQNFLIDLNLLRLLHESAELEPNDVVLEVGTGMGSLTAAMAPQVSAVVTVELDKVLHQLAQEELFGHKNITIIQGDILQRKSLINDAVAAAIKERLAARPKAKFKLVANLPYSIATPLITTLLTWERPPDLMSVTIQKELADRISARPATKDWGSLSLWIQSQCRAETVRVMPPSVFWPRPKVHSAIIRIVLDAKRRGKIADLDYWHEFSRAVFFHRRKFIRAELCSLLKKSLDKEQVDAILARLEIDPQCRAETLPLKTMLKLCEVCRLETLSLPPKQRKIL